MGDENATNSQKKNNPKILSAPSLSDAMKHKIMIAIFVFCFCTIFVSSHALHLANLEIEQCCTLEHEINNHYLLRKCRRMPNDTREGETRRRGLICPPKQNSALPGIPWGIHIPNSIFISTFFLTDLKNLKFSPCPCPYPRYLNNNILLKLLFFFWEHSYHTYYI